MRVRLAALAILAACSCRQAEEPSHAAPNELQDAPVQRPGKAGGEPEGQGMDWTAYLGRCVVAEGYASGAKIGPRLEGGTWSIGVALAGAGGDAAWWDVPGGARVRVQGVVSERADLPVFVQREEEPVVQGIPVPEGTDLDKARRRYVIERASVAMVRSVEAVEGALMARVGQEVALEGVIWSVNGHFWFNHDGVTIHLQKGEGPPVGSDLHGRAVTLRGRLERRKLPRIDQIVLKPNPDLADAFLLHVREIGPHPGGSVTGCPDAR